MKTSISHFKAAKILIIWWIFTKTFQIAAEIEKTTTGKMAL